MYIFKIKENRLVQDKPFLDPAVERRIRELYGTTVVTRILAVVGLIFLLALLSVALIRIFTSIS